MNAAASQVRRATLDDLPDLISMWKELQLPWEQLEKRLTEFQVVVGADGKLEAAMALHIADHQGKLHGETIRPADRADVLREMLWQRIRMVASNHGLTRVWLRETTPFWAQNGFAAPAVEQLEKLPQAFGAPEQPLQVIQLRAESPVLQLSPDQEFALFQQSSREETENLRRKAKVFNIVALVLAGSVFVGVILFAVYFFKNKDKLERAREQHKGY